MHTDAIGAVTSSISHTSGAADGEGSSKMRRLVDSKRKLLSLIRDVFGGLGVTLRPFPCPRDGRFADLV